MEANQKVALNITATIKPEFVNDFKVIAQQTSAKALKEPYAISIQMYQDPEKPENFLIFEEWGNRTYLMSDAHQKSDHILNFFQVASPMLQKPFDYAIYDLITEKYTS